MTPGLLLVAGVCWAGLIRAAEAPAEFSVHWLAVATPVAVEVSGMSRRAVAALEHEERAAAGWGRLFAVYAEPVEPALGGELPPMAGTWRVADGRLRFEPRFPLEQGVRYRAEFRPAQLPGGEAGAAPVVAFFQLPAPSMVPTTSVARIWPSAAVLPENLLKFYVQFSAPMSRGDVYRHLHLRDAAGRAIELPFLELDEELWDPGLTRLTLLIDPGRIKRGVKPLVDFGPLFETGKTYSLTIDAACRDAAGRPLRADFRKEFRVGPADRTPPDPARWTVRAPAVGTRAALVVRFDEPMDHALASRMIAVAGPDGGALAGEVTLGEDESGWTFVPVRAWQPGAHRLIVPTTIEDLAGNNIGKTFDVDLFERVDRKFSTASVKIPFEVR
ncbi:MAG: hypothetical protein EXS32_05775 [Opitutus sp.]|nr:hypothetical protein [Opitutus sp.]